MILELLHKKLPYVAVANATPHFLGLNAQKATAHLYKLKYENISECPCGRQERALFYLSRAMCPNEW